MRIIFRPEARIEALEARDWYENRAAGLGFEFARALEAALAGIVRNPRAFRATVGGCRQALLRKFPYSVVYRADESELLVVAVFHHRRDPDVMSRRAER